MAVIGRGAAVPVFAACGVDAWAEVQDLRGRTEVTLVSSPRHASVLLVAGAIPADHEVALDRVHDQVPHPRASVAWPGLVASGDAPGVSLDGLVASIMTAHGRIRVDRSVSEPDRLSNVEPNEWRGIGPHGQGGEGMMGGTPYGRPMAMTGADRDGLALDQLHLRLGPFLDGLPGGLSIDVTLQGEVVQDCELRRSAADDPSGAVHPARQGPPGVRQAAGLLRHLSWGLHVQGLDGLAARAARFAVAAGSDDADRSQLGRDIAALRKRIGRTGLLWSLRSVGLIEGRGHAADRWHARLEAVAQAVETADPIPPGSVEPVALEDLGEAITGLSLTDAVATIASVDLPPVHRTVAAS